MSEDLYRAQIIDHYRSPRNYGILDPNDISHEDDNPLCGDEVRFDVRLDDDGRVAETRFQGKGCAISLAAASLLTGMVKGKSLEEVKTMGRDDMLGVLGIQPNPMRMKCAMLALKVLQAGIHLYEHEHQAGDESSGGDG